MIVRLSGNVVGHADNWKGAEIVVARSLKAKNKLIPEWDQFNTRERDGEFQFVKEEFKGE